MEQPIINPSKNKLVEEKWKAKRENDSDEGLRRNRDSNGGGSFTVEAATETLFLGTSHLKPQLLLHYNNKNNAW